MSNLEQLKNYGSLEQIARTYLSGEFKGSDEDEAALMIEEALPHRETLLNSLNENVLYLITDTDTLTELCQLAIRQSERDSQRSSLKHAPKSSADPGCTETCEQNGCLALRARRILKRIELAEQMSSAEGDTA